MIVDRSAAAQRADPDIARNWLAEQRVFISSALADTAEARRSVIAAVEALGAIAVRFEEFGRDADAEEAYIAEVDSSTIYVGILGDVYGRPNPPYGASATESEYHRAREQGLRVSVHVAAQDEDRDARLARLIEEIRFDVTTETFADPDDLARRVQRRLGQLASETHSPWVKLDELVFRAREIDATSSTVTVRARVDDEIAHRLDALRGRYSSRRVPFVSRRMCASGEVAEIRRLTNAGGLEELEVSSRTSRRHNAT